MCDARPSLASTASHRALGDARRRVAVTRAVTRAGARVVAVRALGKDAFDDADPWAALGVARGASREAVKRAYKRLAKMHHPDVTREAKDAEASLEIFIRAKTAYEALTRSTTGDLRDVKTEAWRQKWMTQLKKMRDMELTRSRRVRAVREARAARAREAASASDDANAPASAVGTEEMRQQIDAQIAGLRDRGRRRRNVMKPKVRNWREPFPLEDDVYSWNHEVQ